MKFRSLVLAGVLALVGGSLGGCCCNWFCKIPECDPCAPKCNPCEPCCPQPCAPPCAPAPSPCAVPTAAPAK